METKQQFDLQSRTQANDGRGFQEWQSPTVLTSMCCLVNDVQDWAGKKVTYMSYLWGSLRAFAGHPPGAFFDRDADLSIWTKISDTQTDKFEQNLRVPVRACQCSKAPPTLEKGGKHGLARAYDQSHSSDKQLHTKGAKHGRHSRPFVT